MADSIPRIIFEYLEFSDPETPPGLCVKGARASRKCLRAEKTDNRVISERLAYKGARVVNVTFRVFRRKYTRARIENDV